MSGSIRQRGEAYGTGLLAISVVVWGTTPRMTAVGGPHTGALMLTALRAAPTFLAFVVALPFLRFRLPRTLAGWNAINVTGLLMVSVFLAGFTEAIIRAGPGNAIVLASTAPFFVAILSRVLFGERLALGTALGLVVGFAGVVLIVSTQLGGHGGGDTALGLLLALGAALGWAAGTLIVKDMLTKDPGVDVVGLTAGQYLVGGVVLLIVAFASEGSGGTDWSSSDLWLSVAYTSVVGSAIATLAYFGALRRLSATRVTAWTFLSPVVAVLLEVILGHTPRPIVLVGMAVTVAGVAIVNSSPQPAAAEPAAQPAAAES